MNKEIQKPEGVTLRHLRLYRTVPNRPTIIASQGGCTLAYKQDENGIRVAISFCSEKDNFRKQAGRNLALHRLVFIEDSTFVVDMTMAEFEDTLGFIEREVNTTSKGLYEDLENVLGVPQEVLPASYQASLWDEESESKEAPVLPKTVPTTTSNSPAKTLGTLLNEKLGEEYYSRYVD